MKKIVSFIAFSLLLTFASFAQQQQKHQPTDQKEPKTPEEKAQKHSAHLAKELGLTPDQTAQIKTIILNREQKQDEIKAKYKDAPNKKGQHQELEAAKNSSEAEIEKVLTPEQLAKFKEKKSEKQNAKQGGGNKGGHKKTNQ
ncbi:hypothetical protein [Sporocytophaga myxococcoides]|uniref:hypothetical protein n=1 Tax=Sporocytophaga myxococcoides TaxID=153721 RepID=UPI000423BC90|nr:hypothetical protein [Sporocytophaga myxococcoides]